MKSESKEDSESEADDISNMNSLLDFCSNEELLKIRGSSKESFSISGENKNFQRSHQGMGEILSELMGETTLPASQSSLKKRIVQFLLPAPIYEVNSYEATHTIAEEVKHMTIKTDIVEEKVEPAKEDFTGATSDSTDDVLENSAVLKYKLNNM